MMEDGIVLDVPMMQADLGALTDEALELGDELALEVVDSIRKTTDSFRLARAFQEKLVEVRRLRRVIKAEVAG